MIMHFLGGFWLGLLYFYIFPFSKDHLVYAILKILLFVLLIGVGWEVFEILVNGALAQNPLDFLDIISDIFFDLSGGVLAILYFSKRIMLTPESRVHPVVEL
ncbi:MAG: hypothetical protein WC735_02905 [Candidatus Paceibacterota bacterium]|jgi:VanZ family protein